MTICPGSKIWFEIETLDQIHHKLSDFRNNFGKKIFLMRSLCPGSWFTWASNQYKHRTLQENGGSTHGRLLPQDPVRGAVTTWVSFGIVVPSWTALDGTTISNGLYWLEWHTVCLLKCHQHLSHCASLRLSFSFAPVPLHWLNFFSHYLCPLKHF